MSDPASAREALIIEAIGDAANLLDAVEAVTPILKQACRELVQANVQLQESLGAFEARMAAITDQAKTQTVKHLAAHTQEAARRSVEQQSRAMADAARVAFGAQLGGTIERLQATLRPLIERHERRWEGWLTHTAVATAAATATWLLPVYLGRG